MIRGATGRIRDADSLRDEKARVANVIFRFRLRGEMQPSARAPYFHGGIILKWYNTLRFGRRGRSLEAEEVAKELRKVRSFQIKVLIKEAY